MMVGPAGTNTRVYIENIAPSVTEDDLQELFGQLGKVQRKKQKRGYPDQWPWKVSFYTDDRGRRKGDGTLSYEVTCGCGWGVWRGRTVYIVHMCVCVCVCRRGN
jgi:RNA recognition motif-containing protein